MWICGGDVWTWDEVDVKALWYEDIGLLYGSLAAILYQTTPQSSSCKQNDPDTKQHERRRLGRRLKGDVSREVCAGVSNESCGTRCRIEDRDSGIKLSDAGTTYVA